MLGFSAMGIIHSLAGRFLRKRLQNKGTDDEGTTTAPPIPSSKSKSGNSGRPQRLFSKKGKEAATSDGKDESSSRSDEQTYCEVQTMQTGKHFKLMFAFLSAGYVLLGLFLLLLPGLAGKVLVYVLAGLALALGLMRVAFYFTKDDVVQASRSDLASGVVLLVLGVYLFTRPEGLLALLPVLLGFAITYDSVLKISMCFDLRRVGFKAWWVLLLLSAIALAAGILLIISPFNRRIAQIYFACILVGNGIISLIVLLFTLFFNKRLKALVSPEEPENRRKRDGDDSQEPETVHPEELPKGDDTSSGPFPENAPSAPPVYSAEISLPDASEKERPLEVLKPLIDEENK